MHLKTPIWLIIVSWFLQNIQLIPTDPNWSDLQMKKYQKNDFLNCNWAELSRTDPWINWSYQKNVTKIISFSKKKRRKSKKNDPRGRTENWTRTSLTINHRTVSPIKKPRLENSSMPLISPKKNYRKIRTCENIHRTVGNWPKSSITCPHLPKSF